MVKRIAGHAAIDSEGGSHGGIRGCRDSTCRRNRRHQLRRAGAGQLNVSPLNYHWYHSDCGAGGRDRWRSDVIASSWRRVPTDPTVAPNFSWWRGGRGGGRWDSWPDSRFGVVAGLERSHARHRRAEYPGRIVGQNEMRQGAGDDDARPPKRGCPVGRHPAVIRWAERRKYRSVSCRWVMHRRRA